MLRGRSFIFKPVSGDKQLATRAQYNSYWNDSRLNDIPNEFGWRATGFAPAIVASNVDVWERSTAYVFPSVGEWQVRSTDLNDALGGTGAETVRIWLIDENKDILNPEFGIAGSFVEVELNGTTPVNISPGDQFSCALVMDVELGNINQGEIILEPLGGGTEILVILPTKGRTHTLTGCVPRGHNALIHDLPVQCIKTLGGPITEVLFELQVDRQGNGAFNALIPGMATTQSPSEGQYKVPWLIEELNNFRLRITDNFASNTAIFASMGIVIIKDID